MGKSGRREDWSGREMFRLSERWGEEEFSCIFV